MPMRGHGVGVTSWAGLLACLGVMATAGCAAEGAPGLHLRSGRLGHVFEPGEPVAFRIVGPGGPKRWELRDWAGATVARGEVPGNGVISITPEQLGYFELQVTTPGRPDASVTAALARLPAARSETASPFGVMTHFAHGWDPDVVPLIARIGIRHARDEQYWAEIEREPGIFTFPDEYGTYMEAFRRHGIQPLLEMTFANPLYDGGQTPFSPAGQEAFARYGVALLDRYQDQIEALEVWNEINGTWCDGPCRDDRVGTYAGMLAAAWRQVKAARPDVRVVGGATAGVPLPWFEKLAALGALDHLDVISAHSYGRPEDVGSDLAALAALLHERAPSRHVPIWITEAGHGGPSDAERRLAASWLARKMTVLLAGGVERVYWYLLRDYDAFEGLGLLRRPDSDYGRYAPNPAYAAYAALVRELDGATFVRRERTDPRTHAYLFRDRGGQEVRVLWSASGGGAELEFRAATGAADLVLVDLMGNARSLRSRSGRARVTLGEVPVYVRGPAAIVGERREDRLLADSRLDFGARQGAGGWSYGYMVVDPRQPDGAASAFQPLQASKTEWEARWSLPGRAFLAIGRDTVHPGVDGERQIWCVRRWRSDVSGEITLSGLLERPSPEGDGTAVSIRVDGRELASWKLAPPDTRASYALAAQVRRGSVIDVIVTPGDGQDDQFDATIVTTTITAAREPS